MIKKRKALLIFTSFAFMFAPATQTANAQSVTFGSIFQFFNLSIYIWGEIYKR